MEEPRTPGEVVETRTITVRKWVEQINGDSRRSYLYYINAIMGL